jgi:hypothetical protein
MIRVRQIKSSDYSWDYRSSRPSWRHGRYGLNAEFDPFPGYRHRLDVVNETVALVSSKVKPPWDVEIYVADREEIGRSNGFSGVKSGGEYNDDGDYVKARPVGLIMLSGKRIPMHPAMTRYLVAHEYGHNVEYMLNYVRGEKKYPESGPTIKDYLKLRGLPDSTNHSGLGGVWHDSAQEIFACDFRIVVCGVEVDHWPHPGIPRPDMVPQIYDWWKSSMYDLANVTWTPE